MAEEKGASSDTDHAVSDGKGFVNGMAAKIIIGPIIIPNDT